MQFRSLNAVLLLLHRVFKKVSCYFKIFILLIFIKIPHPNCTCVNCSIFFLTHPAVQEYVCPAQGSHVVCTCCFQPMPDRRAEREQNPHVAPQQCVYNFILFSTELSPYLLLNLNLLGRLVFVWIFFIWMPVVTACKNLPLKNLLVI